MMDNNSPEWLTEIDRLVKRTSPLKMSDNLILHELLYERTDLFKCLKDYRMPESRIYTEVFPYLHLKGFEPETTILT